jgi:hypothetical protein
LPADSILPVSAICSIERRRFSAQGASGTRASEDVSLPRAPRPSRCGPLRSWPSAPVQRSRRVGRFVRADGGTNKGGIAPRSSEEEDRHKRETFCRNPAGNQSRPAEPGQQPEASLARWRVTSTAKRRQPDQTPCYRAPKSSLVGSPRRCPKRGPCRALATPGPNWRARSRRGQRTGRMITRVPRELGRPCRLHRHCRPEPPAYQLRVDPQPSPGLMGTNKGHTDGIAKRRQRSAARRASGSRSAP